MLRRLLCRHTTPLPTHIGANGFSAPAGSHVSVSGIHAAAAQQLTSLMPLANMPTETEEAEVLASGTASAHPFVALHSQAMGMPLGRGFAAGYRSGDESVIQIIVQRSPSDGLGHDATDVHEVLNKAAAAGVGNVQHALNRVLEDAIKQIIGRSGLMEEWRADSVRRKRKHKMNKHKHRKRRKAQRHKT